MPPEERTAAKEVKLSSEDQALHDELIRRLLVFNKSEPWKRQMMRRLLEKFKLNGMQKKKERESSSGFSMSTTQTSSHKALTPSLDHFDAVTRIIIEPADFTNLFLCARYTRSGANNSGPDMSFDIPSSPEFWGDSRPNIVLPTSQHLRSVCLVQPVLVWQKHLSQIYPLDFGSFLLIAISSDSSDESVGSPPSRVILFGDIPTVIPSTSVTAPDTSAIAPGISFAAPVVETTLVASPTGLCGLVPYSDSNSDSPDEMDSPEHITPLPATLPFLFTNSPKASDSSDRPPS
ncbi:hypothetical protein Tco_1503313 [Tanacetum coccineum]